MSNYHRSPRPAPAWIAPLVLAGAMIVFGVVLFGFIFLSHPIQ